MTAAMTTIFLDIGGVLVTNGWDHHMQHWLGFHHAKSPGEHKVHG